MITQEPRGTHELNNANPQDQALSEAQLQMLTNCHATQLHQTKQSTPDSDHA